jgi:hypothetical protein
MKKHRIFLVDGKQVAIIKSNEHTYNVRFVKSGKFMEIYKKYVVSWWVPANKPSKPKPPKPQDPQTELDF